MNYKKIKLRIQQMLLISIIRQLRLILDKRISGNVLVFRRSTVSLIGNSSIIVYNGSLTIGKKSLKGDPFTSFLAVSNNAKLIVEGNFSIGTQSRIMVMPNSILSIGKDGYANYGFNIECYDHIIIGNGVAIGPHVSLRDADNKSMKAGETPLTGCIRIGHHVWIGMNVTILKGVTIGDGAIIGAGSVVTKNIPPRSLALGVPARVIKTEVEWNDGMPVHV